MIASSIILYNAWNKECDRPLKWWLLGFSSRYVLLLPLSLALYYTRDGSDTESLQKMKSWLNFSVFIWFIVGQTWIYTLETCTNTAPSLYWTCLVLLIIFYAALALPLLVVIGVCLFLPCILAFHRYFVGRVGVSPEVIQKLPSRICSGERQPKHVSSCADGESKESEDVCSVCMETYQKGDVVKQLPCKHEFHGDCIDRWLNLKDACPLCRAKLTKGRAMSESSEERHPFALMV